MARVLVVDDHPPITRIVSHLLEQCEHEPVQVNTHLHLLLDPRNGLWEPVQVLITGLEMSVSGLEILGVAAAFHPHIRRVAFTRLGPHDMTVGAAAAVADRVLHKASDVMRICDVVEELTRGAG